MKTVIGIIATFACVVPAAAQGPARAANPNAVAEFQQIESVARMPAQEQVKELPRFYAGLAAPLMNPFVQGISSNLPPADLLKRDVRQPGGIISVNERLGTYSSQLDALAGTLSPKEVAEQIAGVHNAIILRIVSQRRAIQVLRNHREELKALIDQDLAGEDPARLSRGFNTIQSANLKEYGDRVLDIYLAGGPKGEAAMRCILFWDNPDLSVRLLKEVEADPKAIIQHGGLLAGMTGRKPVDPVLMKLFESPDPQIRRYAAVALEQSGDPKLAEVLPKLVSDGDPDSIRAALLIAYSLPNDAFVKARPSLLPLMRNPNMDIAVGAVWVFGKQKDMAAAPVLLELIQLPAMNPQNQVRISQAMGSLTGSSFGYDIHNWGPDNPRNQGAIERFARWIEQTNARPI